MKPLDFIVDCILAVIVIILFPVMYYAFKQDSLTTTLVHSDVVRLTENIRSKGYLDKKMYDDFLLELYKTGLTYDISLEHRKIVYEPKYRFRTKDEVIAGQKGAYTGSNEYHYHDVKTDVPIVNNPVNTGSINTETNESVITHAINKPASPDHVHTNACYYGGLSSSTRICDKLIKSIDATHPIQTVYIGDSIITTVTITYMDGSTKVIAGNASGFDKSKLGKHIVTITYTDSPVTINVPCSGHYELPFSGVSGYEMICPLCRTRIPWASVSEYICDTCGKEKLSLYFKCLNCWYGEVVNPCYVGCPCDGIVKTVDLNNGTKTCNITVNVVPRTKTCINGHTYNLNSDGTDPGCPYCKAWLKSLTIKTPESGSLIIYHGTTLQQNGVALLATYYNGNTEIVTDAYVDNLDKTYVGEQNVTISYKGMQVVLKVSVKSNLNQCLICKRYYELYPDDMDPGCPYCIAKTPIFSGEVMKYYSNNYTEDILKEIYKGIGIYYFLKNDYLSIKIENSSRSVGGSFTATLLRGLGDGSIRTEYGGYIRQNGQ